MKYLYIELANLVGAIKRLDAMAPTQQAHSNEWSAKHSNTIRQLVDDYMPSGSGFDNGTQLYFDASHAERLVFTTAFHHMDSDSGMYITWTEHTVTVTPSFIGGFNIRVSGRNRNDIKDHIGDTFAEALRMEIK